MNIKSFFAKNWIHFAAVALFFIIVLIYFMPQFNGMSIQQGDTDQYIGMSHEAYYFKDKTGDEQLWTNHLFGGMPTTQISMIHTGNYIGRGIMNFVNAMPAPAGLVFLHLLCFYIMALCFRVNKWVAILGAIAFAYASYEIIIISAGHNSKSLAVAFMAPVVGGFYMAYRHKQWLGLGLSALFMAFEMSCNHLQITYYLGFLLLALGVVEFIRAIREKTIKKFAFVSGGLIVVYLLAFGINYSNISLTNEYAKSTIRGGNDLKKDKYGANLDAASGEGLDKEYITQWSYGIGESFTLISPYVKGGETVEFKEGANAAVLDNMDLGMEQRRMLESYPSYWGEQPFTSGPVYIGIIMAFLALLGMVYLKDPSKYALLIIGVLALMLSWGKNFMGLTDFFIEHVPGYDKFRTVTIILVLIELIVPLVAILFLDKLIKEREAIKQNKKKLYIASGAFFAFLLVVKIVGLGDNYTSQSFDFGQLNRIETQINEQINSADPQAIQQQFGVDIKDPAQRQTFIADQMKPYSDNLERVKEARGLVFNSSMNRSLIFLFLAIGLLVLLIETSLPAAVAVGGLGLLTMIDLMGVSSNYLSSNEKYWKEDILKQYPYASNAADDEIMRLELLEHPELQKVIDAAQRDGARKADEIEAIGEAKRRIINAERFMALSANTDYKVFDLNGGFSSARASYFHKSLGGYHGAKLRSIQNIYEYHLAYNNRAVYDMLNVKYYIQQGEQGPAALPNPTAMGSGWLVKNLIEVEDRDQEIRALSKLYDVENVGPGVLVINDREEKKKQAVGFDEVSYVFNGDSIPVRLSSDIKKGLKAYMVMDINGSISTVPEFVMENDTAAKSFLKFVKYEVIEDFDPKEEAFITKENAKGLKANKFNADGSVKLKTYSPMRLEYDVNASGDAFAVFSEIYYNKDWKATVNGKEVPIRNVNYILRGLEVPKGHSKVVFTYDSSTYESRNTISFIVTTILLLFLGFTIWKQRKVDNKTATT